MGQCVGVGDLVNWSKFTDFFFNSYPYSVNLFLMEQHAFKNVNNILNTNIYSYLETTGGQSYFLYLNVVHFLTPVLIEHLW